MKNRSGFGKVLLGLGVGVGLGLLFAPQKGSETRKALKKKLDELYDKVKEVDPSEVKENIVKKINEIKKELDDLDKEKVLKVAKKSAENIQKKAEELYKYAVKKGTPILESAAEEVRLQAIKVAKEVVAKLENTESEPKKIKKVKK